MRSMSEGGKVIVMRSDKPLDSVLGRPLGLDLLLMG